MKTNIYGLLAANPSGLLEVKPAMTIAEYRENYGFNLKNNLTIYQSGMVSSSNKDWFAFPEKTLKTLLTVQKQSKGDLLVVYVVETIKNDKVYCHLVLSDEAYLGIVNDKMQTIIQVHQMYSKFLEDLVN